MSALFILFQLFVTSCCLTFEDVKPRFDATGCIEGTLEEVGSGKILLKTTNWYAAAKLKEQRFTINHKSSSDLAAEVHREKSPLALVHEFAQHNAIDYYYYLTGEEGPPHNRVFKMVLTLGNEKYDGEGSSIKNAKKSAAELALQNTEYAMPPTKTKQEPPALTPTVQLNNIATKLGMKVTYVLHNDVLEEAELLEDSSYPEYYSEINSDKSYMSRLNNSIYHPFKERYTKLANDKPGQPFSVVVYVGDNAYAGSGYTVQAARHDAAAKAIKGLSQVSQKEAEACLANGKTCNPNNIKSPISLVYETAQKRKLSVDFEVIGENGPAHEKEFVTRCQVGDVITQGEGKSKKVSKKKAAEKMLKKLEELGSIDAVVANNFKTDLQKKKKKRKKNKNVIRSTAGKIARDAQELMYSALQYFVPDDSKVQKVEGFAANGDTKTGKTSDKFQGDDTMIKYNPKEVLLDLTQQKGVPIQFFDLFETEHKHFSLLSLGIHPQHLCLGDGATFGLAHEKASLEALSFLHKLGFQNIVPTKETFEYINVANFQYLEISEEIFSEKETE